MGKHPRKFVPSTKRVIPCLRTGWLSAAFILLWAFVQPAEAAENDPHLYRPGIRNSAGRYQLNQFQLSSVLASLREKTGLTSLRFDEAGFLVVDDRTRFNGGSVAARTLLFSALDGDKVIKLENYSYNQRVFFASIGHQESFINLRSGRRIESYSLRLDFFDFRQLRGDREALAAFDTGIVVMHELGHVVWALKDTREAQDSPGNCIGYTNRIRMELNYPLRQTYMPDIRKKLNFEEGFVVELKFNMRKDISGRVKNYSYYIYWNSHRIGVLDCPDLKKRFGM